MLFLTRVERVDVRRRVRGKRPGAFCSFAAEQLLRDRAASTAGAHANGGGLGDAGNTTASLIPGCHRNRSVRDQSGRDESGRDRSGRDQSGQDRSGRDQSEREQARPPRVQDNAPWRGQSSGDNRDNSRSDAVNDMDNPFARFRDAWSLRRVAAEVEVRSWSDRAEPTMPQPCRLCPKEFPHREAWLEHVRQEHGGLQRYRNALFFHALITAVRRSWARVESCASELH